MDKLINTKIKNLTCDEPTFINRQRENSAYIDLNRTSFTDKTVVFKPGFVNTKPYLHKKLIQETARVYRDFPCIGEIRVIIPYQGTEYYTQTTIQTYQKFFNINFKQLNSNIQQWRNFINSITKKQIHFFSALYIKPDQDTLNLIQQYLNGSLPTDIELTITPIQKTAYGDFEIIPHPKYRYPPGTYPDKETSEKVLDQLIKQGDAKTSTIYLTPCQINNQTIIAGYHKKLSKLIIGVERKEGEPY